MEAISDNPHYGRWEPKLLYQDPYSKFLPAKIHLPKAQQLKHNKKKDENSNETRIDKPIGDCVNIYRNKPHDSCSDINDFNADLGSYAKPVFQRGGEFEPKKIRKRYVFSRTHWLKGDGYDRKERDEWVQKPEPQYIRTYEVQPGDVRYNMRRSRSASCTSNKSSASNNTHCSTKTHRKHFELNNECETGDKRNSITLDRVGRVQETIQPLNTNPVKNKFTSNVRCKSAFDIVDRQLTREELPHQKHHDFRKLKEIFNCPRPTFDRLLRDRETLTQYEKELLIIEKIKDESQKQKDSIKLVENELKRKQEVTPDKRSEVLLKQVIYVYIYSYRIYLCAILCVFKDFEMFNFIINV